MKTFNIQNTELIKFNGTLAIRFSGGADSSILLYLMAKYFDNRIYVYTMSDAATKYSTGILAERALEKILELTNNKNIVYRPVFAERKTKEILTNTILQKAQEDKVDWMYAAISKKPPTEVENRFTVKCGSDDADFRNPNLNIPTVWKKEKVYVPFINIDKSCIRSLYESENMLDDLFPHTFSCTENEVEQIHCGKCWWCQERLWAFGRLG